MRSMFAIRLSKTFCRQTCFAHSIGLGHVAWSTSLTCLQPSTQSTTAPRSLPTLRSTLGGTMSRPRRRSSSYAAISDLWASQKPERWPIGRCLTAALRARPPGAKKPRSGLVTPIGTFSTRSMGAVRRNSSNSAWRPTQIFEPRLWLAAAGGRGCGRDDGGSRRLGAERQGGESDRRDQQDSLHGPSFRECVGESVHRRECLL